MTSNSRIGITVITSVGLVGSALFLSSTAAQAVVGPGNGPVAPHQFFGGLVNNSDGVGTPAVIKMVCPGPLRPNEKGHPIEGQTIGVFQPEAILRTFGNTGAKGKRIVAEFGPATSTAAANNVVFTAYGSKALPTSLTLPCGGTGTVTFVPLPTSSTAKSTTVKVDFANITD